MPQVEAATRLVVRGLIGLFSAVVLLLFQSVFWTPAASPSLRVLVAAVAVLTCFRPHLGLLVVVAFTPLGRLLNELLVSRARIAEAIMLACLAGALIRGWATHRFRNFPDNRLQVAAVIFGIVVVASCLEQLWLLQMQTDFPGRFVARLAGYGATEYLGAYGGFRFVFYAMLLLEGAALLVLAAHCCDTRQEMAAELVRMLVIVTVAVSALNLAFFANELMDTGDPRAHFVEFLVNERFSAHIGDVNAAGSFLAMGLVIAAANAVRGQANRWIFAAAAVAILPALWLTASRAALLAVVVVCAGAAIILLMKLWRRPAMAVAVGTAGLLVVALTAFAVFPQFFDSRASQAGNIRWMFLQTTARMLQAYPVFGLGVGQYQGWSGRFSSPELRKIYASENAHNNFAQVAGELGLIGLAAFLVVLGCSLRFRSRSGDADGAASRPVLLGVIAFLITCLAGHPLLLAEVSYTFWGALAVAAAGVPALSQPGQTTGRGLIAVSALVLLTSVGPRVYDKMRLIDFSGVTYGLTNGRFADSHARVLVPDTAAQVTVPVRGRGASANDPLEVDISLDGSHVNTVTIVDRRWQSVRIPLQPASSGRLQHLDLTIRPARSRDATRRRDVEIGEPVIIPKPHG
jgi:hypothetical protein